MSVGDIAGLVGAGAAWVGVLVTWRLALRAETAQKAAQKHAEKLQRAAADHAAELQEQAQAHDERLLMQATERQKTEHKAVHDQKTRALFDRVCGMPKHKAGGAPNHDEANALADELCTHLGADPHARYVATAAMLYFLKGKDANRDVRAEIDAAREAVSAHLRDSETPWTTPTDDVVRRWAKGNPSATSLTSRLWFLKPTD